MGSTVPSNFVKSVLKNGVGRYICQLQRLTIKFCKNRASSRGVRDFIENDLLEFTRANPGIVIYLKPRRHRNPVFVAEYLNGNTVRMAVADQTKEEVCQWVSHFRGRSGNNLDRLIKTWHTDSPSIQGIWMPFLNKDEQLNIASFPNPELGKCRRVEKSATDHLLERAKQLRAASE